MITCKAIDATGRAVRTCTLPDQYQSTNVYIRVKHGDASTHGGKVVAWTFTDSANRVREKIPAPGQR